MATHSSILAWRIPGIEEPSGLPSMGLRRVGHDWSNLAEITPNSIVSWLLSLAYCATFSLVSLGTTFLINHLHRYPHLRAVLDNAAKSLQSCPILCDPIDSSPPGSSVPGLLQARTLEWVAVSFSNAWKWRVKVKLLSRVRPSVTPWTAAFQAPSSMGFSRQEYLLQWGAIAFSGGNF